ncbi:MULTISPECIES: hypothetical protein [unclassified Rhodococcus (in: high G+C Gram-positive bacteria)]|uniref:hypothetical protein n=1 Tax=unclassified Rhodococcus (in: high G+C Gram-positive bacteria) TaxID=192944 RepID=UPI000D120D41|nr:MULTISPECIES: hypothetical protein [unclassified Rhodococcus (in: high G+C Gram-positive bacteria)]
MTAPDQVLTDLLAAHYRNCVSEEVRLDPETGVHTYWLECTCVCGAPTSVEAVGDREAALRLADSAHVALVVEQHTQTQTARTREALRKAMEIWPVTVEDRDHWKARAEKLEATVARVEAEATLLERMIRTAPWSRYAEVRKSHLRTLREALGRKS